MAEQKDKLRVFLSYSRKDGETCHWIAQELVERGFLADFDQSQSDPDNIETGISAQDEWWTRLEEMIAHCHVMVFLVSPDSAASDVCDEEIACARNLGKRIIPILVRPVDFSTAPPRLAALNVSINFSDPKLLAKSMDQLCQAIDVDVAWLRDGRKWAARAMEWVQTGRRDAILLSSGAVADAEEWMAQRSVHQSPPGPIFLEFLSASRARNLKERDHLRSISGRAFVEPVKAAVQAFEPDRALRMLAAAMIVTDDPDFSLVPELWAEGAACILSCPDGSFQLGSRDDDGEDSGFLPFAISEDSRRLAAATAIHILKLYDFDTGEELWEKSYPSEVLKVSFLAGGNLFVQLKGDIILLVSGMNGSTLASHSFDSASTYAIDRHQQIIIHLVDKTAFLLELKSGKREIFCQFTFKPWWVEIDPSGRYIIVLGNDMSETQIASRNSVLDLPVTNEVYFTSFSQDGSAVAVGGGESAFVFRTSDGGLLCKVTHEGRPSLLGKEIQVVCLNHDGSLLLTGAQDSTARLWSVSNGGQIQQYDHVDEALITDVKFGVEQVAITNGTDCTVRVWDLETGTELLRLSNIHGDGDRGFMFAGEVSGKNVITSSGKLVQNWPFLPFHDHSEILNLFLRPVSTERKMEIAFAAGTPVVALANQTGEILLFNLETAELVDRIAVEKPVTQLFVSQDLGMVFIAGEKETHCHFRGETGLGWTNSHEFQVHDFSVSDDRKLFAVGSGVFFGSGKVEVFDDTGELLFSASCEGWVSSVLCDDRSGTIWAGDVDGRIYCWGLDGNLQRTTQLSDSRIDKISLSSNGKSLFVSDGDWIRRIDLDSLNCYRIATVSGGVEAMDDTRDGNVIAVTYLNCVKLLDARTGAVYTSIGLHSDYFNRDGLQSCALAGDWSCVLGTMKDGQLVSYGIADLTRIRHSPYESVLELLKKGNSTTRSSEETDILMRDQGSNLVERLEQIRDY